jgi:uncharacterized protein
LFQTWPGLELASRVHELASPGLEQTSGGLELASGGQELAWRGLKQNSGGLELAWPGLEQTSGGQKLASGLLGLVFLCTRDVVPCAEGQTMSQDHQAALSRYFEDHPDLGVASAYLFGSHAEGRAHRESDVDVGVLLQWDRHPTRGGRFDLRIQLGSELIHALKHNEVDVVILNDAPPLLGRKIIYDGIRVFLEDPEADHAYVRDVQILAIDQELWLKKWRKLRLEALAR